MDLLLKDYIDITISDTFGLVRTDDSKISERRLKAEFPGIRQEAMFIVWNGCRPTPMFPQGIAGNHFLHASNYQPGNLRYKANIQDAGAKYVLFEMEPPVSLSEITNGIGFCGDKLTGQTFTPLKSPNSYFTMASAGMISIDKVYFETTGKYLKAWGNTDIRQVDLNYLAGDPLNVSTWDGTQLVLFDPETEIYPVGPDVWNIMYKLAIARLRPEAATPADMTNDGAQSQERVKRG